MHLMFPFPGRTMEKVCRFSKATVTRLGQGMPKDITIFHGVDVSCLVVVSVAVGGC